METALVSRIIEPRYIGFCTKQPIDVANRDRCATQRFYAIGCYTEISSNLPLDGASDPAASASLSPSPSVPPAVDGGGGGGGPDGGLSIMIWVMTLLTALIALMLSSLHGKAAFCCAMALAHAFWGHMPSGPSGSIGLKG
jgi:hypothetical protein